MPGLLAAVAGARSLLLTDHNEVVVDLMQASLHAGHAAIPPYPARFGPMLRTRLECQVSKLVNSDTRPRPTTVYIE